MGQDEFHRISPPLSSRPTPATGRLRHETAIALGLVRDRPSGAGRGGDRSGGAAAGAGDAPAESPSATAPVVLDADPKEAWFAVFAPDGKTLATGGDGCGREVLGRRLVAANSTRVEPPKDLFRCAAFSPDGKLLATGRPTGALTLWDTASGKPLKSLERALGLDPLGGLLARRQAAGDLGAGPEGHGLGYRDVDGWSARWSTCRSRCSPPRSRPTASCWPSPSATRRREAAAPAACGSMTWPLSTQQGELSGLKSTVWSVAFSPDGKTAGHRRPGRSGSGTRSPAAQRSTLNVPHNVRVVAFSPDGKLLLTAGMESTVLGDAGRGDGAGLGPGHAPPEGDHQGARKTDPGRVVLAGRAAAGHRLGRCAGRPGLGGRQASRGTPSLVVEAAASPREPNAGSDGGSRAVRRAAVPCDTGPLRCGDPGAGLFARRPRARPGGRRQDDHPPRCRDRRGAQDPDRPHRHRRRPGVQPRWSNPGLGQLRQDRAALGRRRRQREGRAPGAQELGPRRGVSPPTARRWRRRATTSW